MCAAPALSSLAWGESLHAVCCALCQIAVAKTRAQERAVADQGLVYPGPRARNQMNQKLGAKSTDWTVCPLAAAATKKAAR